MTPTPLLVLCENQHVTFNKEWLDYSQEPKIISYNCTFDEETNKYNIQRCKEPLTASYLADNYFKENRKTKKIFIFMPDGSVKTFLREGVKPKPEQVKTEKKEKEQDDGRIKRVAIYSEDDPKRTDYAIKAALRADYNKAIVLLRPEHTLSEYASKFESILVTSEEDAINSLKAISKEEVQIFNNWIRTETKDKVGTFSENYERPATKKVDFTEKKFKLPSFDYRNDLGKYLNQLGLKGEMAEVGVYQCNFSQQIMKHWEGDKIHLIDINFDKKQDVPNSEFHEMSSLDASHKFEDASLDCVYIDADHSFYGISDDLEIWYDKVKPGGLFCGHDFINSYDCDVIGRSPVPLKEWPTRDIESLNYGVRVAVTRFANRRGLKIHQTAPDEKGSPSWFIIKPHRFVTTLTENFVPGLIALIQSMKENSEIEFCFTVVEYEPISQGQKDIVNSLGIKVDWYPKELLGHFEFDRAATDSPRMAWNLNKFLVWRLPYRGPMCYTDVDVLCLSSLRDLINLRPLSVTMMQSSIGKAPDAMTQYRKSGVYPFNAGWFVYQASEKIFQECQEYARTYKNERIAFGDQVPMNDYWGTQRPDEVNFVDIHWNISHWCLHHPHFTFNWDKVKLLHFAHAEKPWKDQPAHDWMKKGWSLFDGFYSRAVLLANKKLKENKN